MYKWILAPTSIYECDVLDQATAHVILQSPLHRTPRRYHECWSWMMRLDAGSITSSPASIEFKEDLFLLSFRNQAWIGLQLAKRQKPLLSDAFVEGYQIIFISLVSLDKVHDSSSPCITGVYFADADHARYDVTRHTYEMTWQISAFVRAIGGLRFLDMWTMLILL